MILDMLDVQSVLNQAIPTVDAADLQRLWSAQSQHSSSSGIAFSRMAISQICKSENADPLAVWARTALISILTQRGALEKWRKNDDFDESVFHAAAEFPLPHGLQGLDENEFLAMLPGGFECIIS